MMRRGLLQLERPVDQSSFQNRLFTGYTVAVDPDKILEAKNLIHKFLLETCQLLSTGPCTQVYQLQVQFFPHTVNSDENAAMM